MRMKFRQSTGQHLLTLEQAGYVASRKAFVGRRPKTTYRITPTGRAALVKYLEMMQRVIDEVGKSGAGRGSDEA